MCAVRAWIRVCAREFRTQSLTHRERHRAYTGTHRHRRHVRTARVRVVVVARGESVARWYTLVDWCARVRVCVCVRARVYLLVIHQMKLTNLQNLDHSLVNQAYAARLRQRVHTTRARTHIHTHTLSLSTNAHMLIHTLQTEV